ncbi:uncharacterized protein LOC124124167 [Haliotis rufescens]|uniref:uncharacterized protein LOC124124167 n=1 Tax=Haliotis rufescens TaxID=6454 RepID=UPI00201FAC9E|nr:uncharacterized protein LOC124124167 [Haliotis rufescens]
MDRPENCLQAFIKKWRKPKYAAVIAIAVNGVLLGTITIIIIIKVTKNHGNTSGEQPVAEQDIESHVKQTLEAVSNSQESDIYERQASLHSAYEGNGTNLQKPAAHLVISTVISPSNEEVTLRWNPNSGLSHVGRSIEYRDGVVIVREKGYFFIYSTILYHGNGTQELDYGRIIHAVVKQKASELEEAPTPLMRNLQSTPSIRRGRLAYTTSSLGATFYLEANTRVKVTSSVPDNIDTSPYDTYFGLFLV